MFSLTYENLSPQQGEWRITRSDSKFRG